MPLLGGERLKAGSVMIITTTLATGVQQASTSAWLVQPSLKLQLLKDVLKAWFLQGEYGVPMRCMFLSALQHIRSFCC
jgi:hypothetical protein